MNKSKILVVDDHPETLDIITSVLAQHEFNVFSARSGFRGLSIAEQEHPDLIMVDGMMPEMDGWEFCRRVRKSASLAHTPIIMFSAEDDPRQKLAGFDAGADDYLTKPTEPDEMIDRVRALLLEVRRTPKDVQVILSRAHPQFVVKLFGLEVPEIAEKIVEIKGVVREPGDRTKISVASRDKAVDPVGACVGVKGSRVQAIVCGVFDKGILPSMLRSACSRVGWRKTNPVPRIRR